MDSLREAARVTPDNPCLLGPTLLLGDVAPGPTLYVRLRGARVKSVTLESTSVFAGLNGFQACPRWDPESEFPYERHLV